MSTTTEEAGNLEGKVQQAEVHIPPPPQPLNQGLIYM